MFIVKVLNNTFNWLTFKQRMFVCESIRVVSVWEGFVTVTIVVNSHGSSPVIISYYCHGHGSEECRGREGAP